MLKVLDVFSGIGGFSLGLERTGGFETVAFCEENKFCQKVIEQHWKGVPIFPDVRTLRGEDVGSVDVICGGFPCQDISNAGSKKGLDGERSGLWSECERLVGEIRPYYALFENVTALLYRGLERVLCDLAALGYDVEWDVVSACSMGHTHMRERMFIVAYPNGQHGRQGLWNSLARSFRSLQAIDSFEDTRASQKRRMANPSALYRGANDVPQCMDRNRSLGNAIVPEIPERIGRAILEASQ